MLVHLRLLLSELVGTWLYLSLGGLTTSPSPITWGLSLTAGSLLSPACHLNPAVSVGMVASSQASLSSLPARVLGQIAGALLASLSILHTSLFLYRVEPGPESLFTPPPALPHFYTYLVTVVMAALVFQLLFCGSRGSPLYQGLSLATVLELLCGEVGAALNPVREVLGRLVMAHYRQSWQVFETAGAWVWVPVTGTFSGCLTGALIYWIFIQIPHQLEERSSRKTSPLSLDGRGEELDKFTLHMDEKRPPPPPPPPPPPKLSPATTSLFFPARNGSKSKDQTRASQISKHLERYEAVSMDKLDLGHGVTVTVREEDQERTRC